MRAPLCIDTRERRARRRGALHRIAAPVRKQMGMARRVSCQNGILELSIGLRGFKLEPNLNLPTASKDHFWCSRPVVGELGPRHSERTREEKDMAEGARRIFVANRIFKVLQSFQCVPRVPSCWSRAFTSCARPFLEPGAQACVHLAVSDPALQNTALNLAKAGCVLSARLK